MSEYIEDQYEDEYYDDEFAEEDFNDFWKEQLQRTPWWMISLVLHTILAFIASLVTFEKPLPKEEYEYVAEIEQPKKEEVKPEPKRDVFKKTKPVKEDKPTIEDPVVKEAKVEDHHETNDNEDFKMAKGNEEAASDSPFEKSSFDNKFAGVGGNSGGKFGTRFGGKQKSLKEGGGSPLTESAVKAGLIWLKRHQIQGGEQDGSWDTDGFSVCCGSDPKYSGDCDGSGERWCDPGTTGLALLCFLGAGNTTTSGEFQDVVKRAVDYLKKIQDEDGCFGRREQHYMYNHTIAALAMAEAYALSNYQPILRMHAQKGIDFLVKAQNPGSAWRYSYQCGDNDTSVTGWAVMALKSAKVAGLDVPEHSFDGAIAWIDSVTEEYKYRTGYIQKGDPGARMQGVEGFASLEAMTAAGMTSRIFAGTERTDPKLTGGGVLLSDALPHWGQNAQGQSLIDFYYWYYGTLAMFQMGGDFWQNWNEKMKVALVDNQKKEPNRCVDGSWDPLDPWGKSGGRVYSTAINVLSLEIYYRYAQVFGAK